jgi:hypothetical protein
MLVAHAVDDKAKRKLIPKILEIAFFISNLSSAF